MAFMIFIHSFILFLLLLLLNLILFFYINNLSHKRYRLFDRGDNSLSLIEFQLRSLFLYHQDSFSTTKRRRQKESFEKGFSTSFSLFFYLSFRADFLFYRNSIELVEHTGDLFVLLRRILRQTAPYSSLDGDSSLGGGLGGLGGLGGR